MLDISLNRAFIFPLIFWLHSAQDVFTLALLPTLSCVFPRGIGTMPDLEYGCQKLNLGFQLVAAIINAVVDVFKCFVRIIPTFKVCGG